MGLSICLDFDGVLHDNQHPAPGHRMGPPIAGAVDACWHLHRAGCTLMVHTCRVTNREDAVHVYDWLRYFDFPSMLVHAVKPVADVYVDDRGYRFHSWNAATVWEIERLHHD